MDNLPTEDAASPRASSARSASTEVDRGGRRITAFIDMARPMATGRAAADEMARVLGAAASELSSEWCTVEIVSTDGKWLFAAAADRDGVLGKSERPLGDGAAGARMERWRASPASVDLTPDQLPEALPPGLLDAVRERRPQSKTTELLASGGRTHGLVTIFHGDAAPAQRTESLRFLQGLCAVASLRLDNARLAEASRVDGEAAAHERHRLFAALGHSQVRVGLFRGVNLVVEFVHASLVADGSADPRGRPARELFCDNPRYLQVLERVYATGEEAEGTQVPTYRRIGESTIETYQDYSVIPICDTNGNVDAVIAFVSDVTDQVLARRGAERDREALQHADTRMRLAVEAAAVGIWEFDFMLQRSSWDRRCIEITGLPSLGEHPNLRDVLARAVREDRERIRAQVLAAFDPGGDGEVSLECRLVGVEPRWVSVRGRTTFDITAYPIVCSGTIVDVTPRKLSELAREELLEREKTLRATAESASMAKDEFLAMLGHELRNPLSPITTAVDVMRMQGPDTFSNERAIIERQVNHLKRLVDDLLDVSRITRGRVDLRKETVAISKIVGIAVEMVSPLLESKEHELYTRLEPDLFVLADEQRLCQVVVNLLTNAARYTDPRGRIELSAARSQGLLELRVRDNGVGIGPELLGQVFDVFVQGARAIERAQGGIGIGLTLARSLVELHGGTISVSSAGHGRGSEFIVRLPPSEAPTQKSAVLASVSNVRRSAANILVVDDNQDAADLLGQMLAIAGYQVDVAYDGPSAIAIAKKNRHDVALLDLGLPVMDGVELAGRLRALGSGASMIAISGYGQDADRARTAEAGFDDHLVKPVPMDRVLSVVESAVGARRQGHADGDSRSPG